MISRRNLVLRQNYTGAWNSLSQFCRQEQQQCYTRVLSCHLHEGKKKRGHVAPAESKALEMLQTPKKS